MSWLLTLFAPILGALVYGFERRVRARMQQRMGPPLLQPFYDMFKLMDKRTLVVHSLHAMLAIVHFVILWMAVAAIFLGFNLIYAIFLHLFALIALVVAAYSVKSVYSHIGANRELIALVAYEPVLLLIVVGFYLATGSFEASAVLAHPAMILQMPLFFAALLLVIPLKLKKSPFDVVEAHQEIVGGVEVEFSGLFYEFIYMARFLEYLFVYALVFLFGGASYWLGALLIGLVFLLVNLVDNATARLRQDQMQPFFIAAALMLASVNILWMLL